MAIGRRLTRFGGGALLGTGLGTAVAILFAPESGHDLRRQIRERVRQVKLAGLQAQAAKTDQLVHKFRQNVKDPDALADKEAEAHELVSSATVELGASSEPTVAALPG
jgi:gas vesicle protein